ncbi:PREDICTED: ras GTPase-activating protein 1-like isoform X2 [Acropora digitifera]|uniref:ras GTPase-activating protein 1-like isoform X2 n=1 Tax=Acropora digitifera TaxID=70779 RepID=UPI00077A03C6|nr:PREDICTED: ras GTPase-activating protein 1-like isoform X2 [Acropora digitifera]
MASTDRQGLSGCEVNLLNENEADDHFEDEPDPCLDEEEEIELALSAPAEDQWYHGKLDRTIAEERLVADGKEGAYLVRESDRKPGTYSLSFFGKNGISHFRVTAVCGDYYIGGRQFVSLNDLIGYYTIYSCLLKDEHLCHPVPPPEPVGGKKRVLAKYTYNKAPETDELSFQQGDVFVVDNVIDSDWLWVTAQKNQEKGVVPAALVEDAKPDLDPCAGRPWFFSNISKQEAHDILFRDGVIGSFLIRPSDKSPGDYSLSLRAPEGITRFLIKKQAGQYSMGGRIFDSVDAVVGRYKHEHIIEGLSLKEPVSRAENWDFPHRPMTPSRILDKEDGSSFSFRSGPVILNRRQQESGSNFKRGYLVKKGHRNKWKRMFFVLDGLEQHLYFFENEKRTKPKGMMDLSFSMVYEVHQSFFGRPNCFQVVVRAFNESRMFYLCADTQDLANEWMEAIEKFCGKVQNTVGGSVNERDVKQLRSLEVNVIEAHSSAKVSHPYCTISLNEVKTCITKTQESHSPIWNEEFKFNDLPSDVSYYTVDLYNRNKRSKDVLVGSAMVSLTRLPKGNILDEWYQLLSLSHAKAEVGSIRLRSKFTHEIIMPVEEYSSLKEILLDNDLQAVKGLGQVCKDRVTLASILLKIFRHERQEIFLLKTMNSLEVEKQEEVSTLFRGTSLTTTLMDQYMKMVAIPYVQQTIGDVVVKILDCKQSCELNPAKLEKGADTVVNLKQLLEFLFEGVNAIVHSAGNCPRNLRYLFCCLQQNVRDRWSENEIVRSRVVSGFLFLRLICPAIMNPKICNMMSETPSSCAARTLTLVAKCLQNLANLIEFGAKESFMTPVNPFILKNKEKMVNFLDELSNVKQAPQVTEQVSSDASRDLASLHDICCKYESELQQLSSSQPALKKLVAVTEALRQREQQYLQENYPLPSRSEKLV